MSNPSFNINFIIILHIYNILNENVDSYKKFGPDITLNKI